MSVKLKRCKLCGQIDRKVINRAMAKKLRAQGWTYVRIADYLDSSLAGVYFAVNGREPKTRRVAD